MEVAEALKPLWKVSIDNPLWQGDRARVQELVAELKEIFGFLPGVDEV